MNFTVHQIQLGWSKPRSYDCGARKVHKIGQKRIQHSSRRQDNIKIDIVEIQCAEFNWTNLASDRAQSWENTKEVMKLQLHRRHSKSFVLYSNNVYVFIDD